VPEGSMSLNDDGACVGMSANDCEGFAMLAVNDRCATATANSGGKVMKTLMASNV
jgi:hypothetical protein